MAFIRWNVATSKRIENSLRGGVSEPSTRRLRRVSFAVLVSLSDIWGNFMAKYLFGDHVYSPDSDAWQRILQKGYAAKVRPVCQCVSVERAPLLYIAMVRGQYVIKRMPYTGPQHAPHCEHYEPPPELSGLGQVNGSAIREEPETETTTLSLDFALTKGRSRTPGTQTDIEHESVRSDGTKLTMRGLLHYLYDEAGLTRWTPAMLGKRSWFIVRRELLAAAFSKKTKGRNLPELLYIPENFSLERADDIKGRQLVTLSALSGATNARMLLIGEVKNLEDARFGKGMVIKHMPDLKLMLTDDMAKHLTSRFAHQLQLWGHLENTQLLIIGTISRSSQGIFNLESACLANVNSQWIPFENAFEWELLEKLHSQSRRFVKGLRYNLPSSKPLASVVMQDTGDSSSALFVVPQEFDAAYESVINELAEKSKMTAWVWRTGTQSLPVLPGRMVGHNERP